MAEDWMALSEAVAGKVLRGEINPDSVDPDDLYPPYNEIVRLARSKTEYSDIVEKAGFYAVSTCEDAAERIKDLEIEWPMLLQRAALRVVVGKQLMPIAKKLERGEDADIAKAVSLLGRFELEYKEFTGMDKVEKEENIWVSTFYHPIDHFMGGVPRGCLTIIAGPPGVGKTSLLARILINCAKNGKQTAWFSLEMTLATVLTRILELEPKMTKKQRGLILGTEDEYDVDEVYAAASRVKAANPDLHMIAIDFADLMVQGEEKTGKASHIYRTCSKLAKRLNIPILLVSQLSEGYVGGIPKVHHIRWSRLAEAVARMILLIWNPDMLWADQGQFDKKSRLTYMENHAYLIEGKSNFGYKYGSTGAVLVPFDPKLGWGDVGTDWIALAGV